MKFGLCIIVSVIISIIFISELSNMLHKLAIKESLDIQESRNREDKLARYTEILQYQIDVLVRKGLK